MIEREQSKFAFDTKMKTITDSLVWARRSLDHYVISKKAIYFILDSQFRHCWEQETIINFICENFRNLDSKDYFALDNLGE